MKNILYIITLSLCISTFSTAQSNKDLEDLNNVVLFTNENIHGLFIIHRLLELCNQDINKYVDLEGYKLNNYGNSDIPFNIFEDPKNEFYRDIPPNAIYKNLAISSKFPEVAKSMDRIYQLSQKADRFRFTIADFIEANDMTQPEKLGAVYEMLEQCVRLYDDFYTERNVINTVLQSSITIPTDSKHADLYYKMTNIHRAIINLVTNMRTNDAGINPSLTSDLQFYLDDFENYSSSLDGVASYRKSKNNILAKGAIVLQASRDFQNGVGLPEAFKLYGLQYYYYNYKILQKVNYCGVGVIFEMNEIIKTSELPFLQFIEMPHYFQVIYPERIAKIQRVDTPPQMEPEPEVAVVKEPEAVVVEEPKKKVVTEVIESNKPDILTMKVSSGSVVTSLPEADDDRGIKISKDQIFADKGTLSVELYDHLLQDGDVISLNFNGDWILEDHSLEKTPTKLKIGLNEEGKNFLLVHAVNTGVRPPNTIAVSYRYKGKRKRTILLRSDMETSALLEIVPTN